MGKAREVMDAITKAATNQDFEALRALYAPDAVVVDPQVGEVTGEGIIDLYRSWAEPIPDADFEPLAHHEVGDVAIDEGYLTGTNTGSLTLPSGETLQPTGKSIRVRSCDVLTVRDGRVISHHFYYDQLEFLGQLGLASESAAV